MQVGKIYSYPVKRLLFLNCYNEDSKGIMPKNSLFVILQLIHEFKDGWIIAKILFEGKIYYIDVFRKECILHEEI